MRRTPHFFLAALGLLVACSSSSSDGGNPDGGVPDGGGGSGGDPGLGGEGLEILRFEAEPLGLPPGGGTVTLTWEVLGADALTIDPGADDVTGESITVEVTETTTFRLNATAGEESVFSDATVIVAGVEEAPFDRAAPTAVDSIELALLDGTIDQVDALRYKVFAFFGDDRLPPEYAVEGRIHGTPIMKELALAFESLPAEVQDELRPFRLPPNDPRSWYAAIESKTIARKGAPAGTWISHDVPGIRFWWDFTLPEAVQNYNKTVASAASASLQKLVDYMGGKEPIPNTTSPDIDPDPYNVFIVITSGDSALGWCTPGDWDTSRSGYPSHVVINLDSISDESTSQNLGFESLTAATTAHELMHAIQFAYDTVDNDTRQLTWLEESSATWAEEYVYPDWDTEHVYADSFMDDPELALDNLAGSHEYGGYLFHLYLQRKFGDATVRQIWEATESKRVFEAIDDVLGGTFHDIWWDFTSLTWNEYPFDKFIEWDVMTEQIFDEAEIKPTSVSAQQEVYEMQLVHASDLGPALGVDYLSAQYFHYKFDDPSVHTILFANGFTFDMSEGTHPMFSPFDEIYSSTKLSEDDLEGRHVTALVKAGGEWHQEAYELTEVAFVPFCQDYADERIEELVLIFSNSRFKQGERVGVSSPNLDPRLFVSNIACGNWEGYASVTRNVNEPNETETLDVSMNNLVFSRNKQTVEQLMRGGGDFELMDTIIPVNASLFSFFGGYTLEDASVDWSYYQRTDNGSEVCITNGSGMLSEEDAFFAQFDLRPTLLASANTTGSLYRSYWINLIFQTSGNEVTESCPSRGTSSYPFFANFAAGSQAEEFGTFEISSDGLFIERTFSDNDATILDVSLVGVYEQ